MKAKIWNAFKISNYIIFTGLSLFLFVKLTKIYQLTHVNNELEKNTTLSELINNEKINFKEIKNTRYFYGKDINNYVWFNSRLWRAVKTNQNGVLLVTNDAQTTLAWGEEINFHDSYIDNWLNHDRLYPTITDLTYLKSNFELGLLNNNDYINTGGKNSFLNNNTYYYLQASKNKLNYVANDGSLAVTDDLTFGIGVRPTLVVRNNARIKSGIGTATDPFIIGKVINIKNQSLNNAQVGSYVKYNNDYYRVMTKSDHIKLISTGLVKADNGGTLISTFSDEHSNYYDSDIYKLLIKKSTDKELLELSYYDDVYGDINNYYYEFNKINKNKVKVSIPSIGDMFASPARGEDYWLSTKADDSDLVMSLNSSGQLYVRSITDEIAIKPIIKLNRNTIITNGIGTLNKPYIIKGGTT